LNFASSIAGERIALEANWKNAKEGSTALAVN
jgi:hypothetical protein